MKETKKAQTEQTRISDLTKDEAIRLVWEITECPFDNFEGRHGTEEGKKLIALIETAFNLLESTCLREAE